MSETEGMTPAEAELLAKLSRQFPQKFIHGNPSGGGSYVAHPVIRQRLLATFGLYDFTLVEILRGAVAGKAPNPQGNSARAKAGTPALEGVVVGAVCRLTVPRADGRLVSVEDVGDCEDPHNWPHDGARMKDAMSDAVKRCAMGMSVALHLYCKPGEYRLDAALAHMLGEDAAETVDPDTGEITSDAEQPEDAPRKAPAKRPARKASPPAADTAPAGDDPGCPLCTEALYNDKPVATYEGTRCHKACVKKELAAQVADIEQGTAPAPADTASNGG